MHGYILATENGLQFRQVFQTHPVMGILLFVSESTGSFTFSHVFTELYKRL